MKNIAVVLAGGTGARMGSPIPKQFLDLEGEAVVLHSMRVFDQMEDMDELAVVVHPDWMSEMEALVRRREWRIMPRLIAGGTERYWSTLNAVAAYLDEPDDTNLIFHDAARPWLSAEVIARVLKALETHEAVGVGVPSTDTVWEVRQELSGERFIGRIPERKLMWRAQTPQAFRLWVIRDAYQRAMQDPSFSATDDCGVVRRYMPEVKITVVEGEEKNRKITFKEDLE